MVAIQLNQELLQAVVALAMRAGTAILDIYQRAAALQITQKSDASPLTEADLIAHQIISSGLSKFLPAVPVLSEEAQYPNFCTRSYWEQYWLIDPLDGTKEFIARTGEFTVNIALIDRYIPILGVVYAPVLQTCYFAAQGIGAFKQEGSAEAQPIKTRSWQSDQALKVVASRRHNSAKLDKFLVNIPRYEIVPLGSSLKFCLIAEGQADLYPRLGLTSEWDTAAAQCVVEQAGGRVLDMQLQPLCYNMKDSLLNPHFIVVGDQQQDWATFLSLR